jgi:RNA recognition motif-containing protein
MGKNLYVGNLPYSTTADDLREEFGKYGTVTSAQIVMDRETGRSRGFGFVEMAHGGDEAIDQLNGAVFQGRALTVNEAKPREPRGPMGGGGGFRGPRGGGDRGGGFGGGGGYRDRRGY